MPRSKLGSVWHSVTSHDGSFTFRASDEWEATEIAPGGYEGAKEVIPEKWLDKYPGIFVQGATFRSWHEQSGDCIWGGRLRERPSRNGGRAELSVAGWGQLADRNAGRLLYMSTDLSSFFVDRYENTDSPKKWDAEIDARAHCLNARRSRSNETIGSDIPLATSAAADNIIDTTANHGLAVGDRVSFTELTGGAGLDTSTRYYVISSGLFATGFRVSTTSGGSAVDFTTDITAGKVHIDGGIGTAGWKTLNKETNALALVFTTPGTDAITRFAAALAIRGNGRGACLVDVSGTNRNFENTWHDAWVLSSNGTVDGSDGSGATAEVDISGTPLVGDPTGPVFEMFLTFSDLTDVFIAEEKYGAWPAFRPSNITNDYDSWVDGLIVEVSGVRVGGIAKTDYFSVSSVARDIAARMNVADLDVDELGFNALPLDVRDGMTYGEALDYVSLLSNARWLILDSGGRRYMDFGKFDKRKWTVTDPHQDIDLLPLERFDRIVVPYRMGDGKSIGTETVVADPNPLDYPNSYGRLRLNEEVTTNDGTFGATDWPPGNHAARVIGERLVDHLAAQRWGGSGNLSHVQDNNGVSQSAYFVHAGDVLRVPNRSARARIARKSMTNRGVNVEFESVYAPLDRLLARRSKRMQRT